MHIPRGRLVRRDVDRSWSEVPVSGARMSGFVYVCDDETNRDGGVELPVEENGNLLISVLQSQFERASGLKYR